LRLKISGLIGDDEQLREFLLDRARYYFRDVRGFNYDEVSAVLAAGSDDLVDAEQRLDAIRSVRPTQHFEPLAASFKRIKNILRQAQFEGSGSVSPALLEAGPEEELFSEFNRVRDSVYTRRRDGDYRSALSEIAAIRPKVDTFFDKVLVNAPDERVRHNRLVLLSSLLSEFSTIADFSEIVVTTQ
jgi:glycyl-tRNA synthetase beta chain